jgi:hypothetical protein
VCTQVLIYFTRILIQTPNSAHNLKRFELFRSTKMLKETSIEIMPPEITVHKTVLL